jgi:hypothetical protein
MSLHPNLTEAANRAEATALLIRHKYNVYRPEADVSGVDLILLTPTNKLIAVQMKSRPTVNKKKYGGADKNIWMLFPDPTGPKPGRDWFLIKHDALFQWWEQNHGSKIHGERGWHTGRISEKLDKFLRRRAVCFEAIERS